MNYEVVDLPDESGVPCLYYKVPVRQDWAILYFNKADVDSGETSIEAELEALLRAAS